MIQEFTIPCRLPGLNEMLAAAKIRRGKFNKYSEMKAEYGEVCTYAIRQANLFPITGPIHVGIHWIERNRRRDPDNIRSGIKAVLDSLVKCKILENDGWDQILSITDTFDCDPKLARVIVTLSDAPIVPEKETP